MTNAEIFYDSFERDTLGDKWWDKYGIASLNSTCSKNGTKSLKISPTSINQYVKHSVSKSIRKGTFETWVYSSCTTESIRIALSDVQEGGGWIPFLYINFKDDGYIHLKVDAEEYSMSTYEANKWYFIKIDFDIENQKTHVFIKKEEADHPICDDDYSGLQEGRKVDHFEFFNLTKNNSPSWWFDGVKIIDTERIKVLDDFENPVWTKKAEMENFPEDEGWDYEQSGSTSHSKDDGVLYINNSSDGGYLYYKKTFPSEVTSVTLEGRIKVSQGTQDGSNIRLYIVTSNGANRINIYGTGIKTALGTFHSMNTYDDYHVYRIVTRKNTFRVYVDGILKIAEGLTTGTGNEVQFGCASANQAGESWWDYVKYSTEGAFEPVYRMESCTNMTDDEWDSSTENLTGWNLVKSQDGLVSASNSILIFDSTSAPDTHCYYWKDWNITDASQGVTIEAKIKVVQAGDPVNVDLWWNDGEYYDELRFSSTKVWFYSDSNNYFNLDTSVWHVYRITQDRDGIRKLYVDEKLCLVGKAHYSPGSKKIYFGDGTASTSEAKSEWDYIYYSTKHTFPPSPFSGNWKGVLGMDEGAIETNTDTADDGMFSLKMTADGSQNNQMRCKIPVLFESSDFPIVRIHFKRLSEKWNKFQLALEDKERRIEKTISIKNNNWNLCELDLRQVDPSFSYPVIKIDVSFVSDSEDIVGGETGLIDPLNAEGFLIIGSSLSELSSSLTAEKRMTNGIRHFHTPITGINLEGYIPDPHPIKYVWRDFDMTGCDFEIRNGEDYFFVNCFYPSGTGVDTLDPEYVRVEPFGRLFIQNYKDVKVTIEGDLASGVEVRGWNYPEIEGRTECSGSPFLTGTGGRISDND